MHNFFLGPRSREEQGHSAERHHPDCIGHEGDWHCLAHSAHCSDILLVVQTVNDRAGAKKEKGFEEAMREEVHDPCNDTSHPQRDHHQPELRDRGVSKDPFDIELSDGN